MIFLSELFGFDTQRVKALGLERLYFEMYVDFMRRKKHFVAFVWRSLRFLELIHNIKTPSVFKVIYSRDA